MKKRFLWMESVSVKRMSVVRCDNTPHTLFKSVVKIHMLELHAIQGI